MSLQQHASEASVNRSKGSEVLVSVYSLSARTHHDVGVVCHWLCIRAHSAIIKVAMLQVFVQAGVAHQRDGQQRAALDHKLTQTSGCCLTLICDCFLGGVR